MGRTERVCWEGEERLRGRLSGRICNFNAIYVHCQKSFFLLFSFLFLVWIFYSLTDQISTVKKKKNFTAKRKKIKFSFSFESKQCYIFYTLSLFCSF